MWTYFLHIVNSLWGLLWISPQGCELHWCDKYLFLRTWNLHIYDSITVCYRLIQVKMHRRNLVGSWCMVMCFVHLAKECSCLYCWVQEHKCSACHLLLWVKLHVALEASGGDGRDIKNIRLAKLSVCSDLHIVKHYDYVPACNRVLIKKLTIAALVNEFYVLFGT